jgi:hypothetical protein
VLWRTGPVVRGLWPTGPKRWRSLTERVTIDMTGRARLYHALRATVGDRYRAYAAQHKRLVPLVW